MGPKFSVENEGKVALIHSALYRRKSAGRDFRNHQRCCKHHNGFKSCPADPDVWMRSAIKSDGTKVYEYVLQYTDDASYIGVEAESILRKEIGNYDLTQGDVNWTSHVVPWRSSESELELPNKAETPLCTSYRPVLDVTPELKCSWFYVRCVNYFLAWMCSL
jgi:hypothetical protein